MNACMCLSVWKTRVLETLSNTENSKMLYRMMVSLPMRIWKMLYLNQHRHHQHSIDACSHRRESKVIRNLLSFFSFIVVENAAVKCIEICNNNTWICFSWVDDIWSNGISLNIHMKIAFRYKGNLTVKIKKSYQKENGQRWFFYIFIFFDWHHRNGTLCGKAFHRFI